MNFELLLIKETKPIIQKHDRIQNITNKEWQKEGKGKKGK